MNPGPPPCFEASLQKAGDPNSWTEAFCDPSDVAADLDADLRGEDRGPTSFSHQGGLGSDRATGRRQARGHWCRMWGHLNGTCKLRGGL